MQSITIFYPVRDVPDYEDPTRRPLRPRQVKFYASRLNGGPWQLTSPLVIGREVLKSGALGLVDRSRSTVVGYWPDWLGAVTRSVRAALEAGLAESPTRHQPLTDQPIDHVPTQAGLDYLAIRRQQNPRGANQ